jgi:hypothetical protein
MCPEVDCWDQYLYWAFLEKMKQAITALASSGFIQLLPAGFSLHHVRELVGGSLGGSCSVWKLEAEDAAAAGVMLHCYPSIDVFPLMQTGKCSA